MPVHIIVCLLPPDTMSGIWYALNKCLRKIGKERITLSKQVPREEEILSNVCGMAQKEALGPLTCFGPFWWPGGGERELSNGFTAVSFHSDYSLSHTPMGSVGMTSEMWGLVGEVLWRRHIVESVAIQLRDLRSLWYAHRLLPVIIPEQCFLGNSKCPWPASSLTCGNQRYGARNPVISMFPTTPSVWVDYAGRGVKQGVKCVELEAVGRTFYQSSDV